MCTRRIGAAFCFLSLMGGGAFSQDASPRIITAGPPVPLTEQLKQHRVGVNRADLLRALQGSDDQARYLAALRLAEERDIDAIPPIEQALKAEKVPETRINIAIALAQLGQTRGTDELILSCKSPDLPDYFRVRAMIYMLPLGNRTCFKAALDLLESDPQSRDQILSLLPRYHEASKEESNEILRAAVQCLSDESGAVRVQASITLSAIANSSAIPYLQNAIATEQDDAVRSQMRESLEKLQKQHR